MRHPQPSGSSYPHPNPNSPSPSPQAFRQLSWKFHGKLPSRKRREKRMLEVEKQMTEQTKDRAMDYMDALQHVRHSIT